MQSQAELPYTGRDALLTLQFVVTSPTMPDRRSYRDIARHCRKLIADRCEMTGDEVTAQLQLWSIECDRAADRVARTAPREHPLERARRLRMRAEEYRAAAEQMQSVAARASYLSVAETYEAMARSSERIDAKPTRDEKNVG